VRLPDDTQRISIVGTTGSGKTAAGVWHLSKTDFIHKPWIIYDFKRDPLLAEIKALEGTYEITTEELPDKPGLYFVHPHPDDGERVQEQLRGVWERRNIGIYADEGYMLSTAGNRRSWFRTLLTQGRSLHIPIITLAQRPAWIDRFVFSESEFFQVFRLNHTGDRKKMMEYIPADISEPLPEYHSYYYDVGRNKIWTVKPVPTGDQIVQVFAERLESMKEIPVPKPRRVFI
jgi:hypothetical protein